ncbi:MAG TPA: metallophosphoesterase [Candidatus Bathyarchaeia archaeon]|nr:metallophosphoesterase [Candidatus Bathyarchaeia archaeon]
MNNAELPIETLIHIADVHFWKIVCNPIHLFNKRFLGNMTVLFKRRREFDMAQAEPYADTIAEVASSTGAKTVLLTGDFASTSLPDEFVLAAGFVRGLRARGLEIHLLPGNHDVYTFESVRRKRFEHYFGEFLPRGGYPSAIRLPGGTPLILVPTVRPRPFSARGHITEKEVDQVRQLIEQAGDRLVVAGHYPLLHRTQGYMSNPWRQLKNAGKLRRVLGESQKHILYAAGHVHAFSYERDPLYANLEHLTTGAFFKRDIKREIAGEFSEIRIYQDRFEIHRHVHKGGWISIQPVIHEVDKKG